MLKLMLVVVGLLWAAPLAAATYYIDISTGLNSRSCATATNPATPKQYFTPNGTGFAGGLNCLAAGDTLLVRGGVYPEHFEPGTEGVTLASGTSWSNKVRIAAYPNGCSPRSPNPCGTAGEDVTLKPTNESQQGQIVNLGYDAASSYVEFDGINFDSSLDVGGSLGSPGVVHGAISVACYETNGARYIRFQNAELIGNKGDPSQQSSGGVHINVFAQTSTPHHANCPGGFEFLNLKIHGGASNTANWTPGRRYTAYGYYVTHDNTLIERNEVYDTRYYGIHANCDGCALGGFPVTGLVVRNNVVHDITRGSTDNGQGSTDAIIVGDGFVNPLVYNNLVYNTGNPAQSINVGIHCYAGSTGVKLYHNTVYNVIGYGIYTDVACGTSTIQNNISHLSTLSNYQNDGSGTTEDHNLRVGTDPGFVSAGTANFHLAMGSPAIDVGVCLGAVTADAEGNSRPQGLGCDIGVYEYLATGSLPGLVSCTPANGATGVDLFPTMACTSSGATSFDVYFGQPGNTSTPLFSTTFTAANSADIGPEFTPYAAVGITNATLVSNRVRSVSTTAYSVEALTSVTLSADQWCRVQLVTVNNASQNIAGCLLRGSAPAPLSGYLVGLAGTNQTGSWIARITNGLVEAYLALDSVTVWAVNDRVEARAVGSTITLYRYPNTTPILTVTDTTYATGRVGLVVFSATVGAVELDNFEAGNLGLPFLGNQASGTYAASNLAPATVYSYQFVAKNSVGDTLGPLNSFTTTGTTATPVGIRVRFKSP